MLRALKGTGRFFPFHAPQPWLQRSASPACSSLRGYSCSFLLLFLPPSLSLPVSQVHRFSVRLLSFCPPLCPASPTFHTLFSFFLPLLFFLALSCLVWHCCLFSDSTLFGALLHESLCSFSLSSLLRIRLRLISSCSPFLFSSSHPLTFARVSVFPCDISLTVP